MAIYKFNYLGTESFRVDKMYIITGTVGRGRRYVSLNRESGKPMIVTDVGYRANDVALFADVNSAEKFMDRFLKSRKNLYCKNWDVAEYKPKNSNDKEFEIYLRDSEYGTFYTAKCVSFKHKENTNSKCEIDETIECLTNLKTQLENLKEEIKNIEPSKNKITEEMLSEITEAEEALMLAHISRVYEITDIFSEEQVIKCIKEELNLSVGDIFDEDDILDYLVNNFYVEDLVTFDWR